jgi:hypothetical protein
MRPIDRAPQDDRTTIAGKAIKTRIAWSDKSY